MIVYRFSALAAAAIGMMALPGPAAAQSNNDNGAGTQAYDWSGFSGGGFGGGAFGGSDFASALGSGAPCGGVCYGTSQEPHSLGVASGVLGIQVGYNFRAGNMVYGLEGDVSLQNLHGSKDRSVFDSATGFTYNFHDQVRSDWAATIRPRVGMLYGGNLYYVTGGLAITELNYSHGYSDDKATPGSSYASGSKTVLGYTIGAGAEMPISRTMSLRAEYLFADYGDVKIGPAYVFPLAGGARGAGTTCGVNLVQCFDSKADLTTHTLRLGLNMKF